MKVLIYSHIIPYPLNRGGIVAQFTFMQELVKYHQVVFVTAAITKEDIDNLRKLEHSLPGLHTVNVASHVAQSRFTYFQKLATAVSWFLQKNSEAKKDISDYAYYLDPIPEKPISLLTIVRSVIAEQKPDIVQVDFTENADVPELLHRCYKSVLIAHEINYVRLGLVALQRKDTSWYIDHLVSKAKPIELAFYKSYDTTIVFSKEDAVRLKDEGVANVQECGFGVSNEMFANIGPENYPVSKLTFLGPDSHHPNYDAVQWYITSLAKKIKQQSGLTLHVIGNWSQKNIRSLNKNREVVFEGYADDLHKACKDSIMIVPLRIGSGIRTKILDGMAMGIPIISTALGCEGIGVTDGKEIMIAENEQDFSRAIEKLMHDTTLLQLLRKNASQFVKNHFSSTVIYQKRIEIYKKLLAKTSAAVLMPV